MNMLVSKIRVASTNDDDTLDAFTYESVDEIEEFITNKEKIFGLRLELAKSLNR